MSIHTASLQTIDQQPASARTAPPAASIFEIIRQWADVHRFWILAVIVLMYLAGFTGRWAPESDSALYLSLGRSLALGNGYTDLGQPNHLVYPGLPWLIAGTFKIFGVDHLFPVHLLMLLLAGATLAMIYAMLTLRIDRPTAVVVTAIVALSDTFFRYAMKILTDMPFMAGVMAVLLGCELIGWHRQTRAPDHALPSREKPALGWMLIIAGLALATVMRPAIWALLFTLIAAAILCSIRKRGQWKYPLIATLALLMVAGFFLLDPRRSGNPAVFGSYEVSVINALRSGEMFRRMIHDNLGLLFGYVTAEALLGMRVGPGMNQVVAIIAIVLAVGLWRRQPLWSLWVLMTLLMMLAMLPVRRYYLPILPFLVLGAWLAIGWLNQRIADRGIANLLCAGLLILLAGPNVVRCANFSLQQHDIFIGAKSDRESEMVMENDFARRLKSRLPADSVILAPRRFARVLGYLSTRRVIAAGSGVQLSSLHAPAFVILPLNGGDGLITGDLSRLGLNPGRQVFVEKASSEFQFAVDELDLPH